MKLNRALSEKNRLAKKIKKLQDRITTHNSYIKGNTPIYNIQEQIDELEKTTIELVAVKTQIANTNLKVVDKIYRLSELKSQAAFIKNLNIKEGKMQEGRWGQTDVNEWESELKNKERDAISEKLEIEIDSLQAELDKFNFETDI